MRCSCKREQHGPIYYHTRCWYHRLTGWLDSLFLPPVEYSNVNEAYVKNQRFQGR